MAWWWSRPAALDPWSSRSVRLWTLDVDSLAVAIGAVVVIVALWWPFRAPAGRLKLLAWGAD
jgi:hypothetical protein